MDRVIEMLAQVVMPIEEDFDPASAVEIAVAETGVGINFPLILRDVQAKYGRCMFSGEAVVNIASGPIGIFTLFGCKGEVGNLVSDFDEHPDMKAEGMIPFADDMFNNRFVWGSKQGDVLFIDYANHRPPVRIATSLEDFFERVEVTPD